MEALLGAIGAILIYYIWSNRCKTEDDKLSDLEKGLIVTNGNLQQLAQVVGLVMQSKPPTIVNNLGGGPEEKGAEVEGVQGFKVEQEDDEEDKEDVDE